MAVCAGRTLRAVALALVVVALASCARAEYKVGVGIADVTGPPTEIIFMGYAQMRQRGRGLHLRQFSRAFIVDDGSKRFTFVSVDCGMIGNGLRKEVVEALRPLHGDTYTERNLMITGTHTHSAPGGFLQDLLFDLSTLGFVKETFESLVAGIALSVHRAHQSMQKGRVLLTSGELLDVSVNRSPTAYQNNPEAERRNLLSNFGNFLLDRSFVEATFGNNIW